MTEIKTLSSPRDLEEMPPRCLLGISSSMKGGTKNARSASRELLTFGLRSVSSVYPDVRLLDLRQHPLPYFDGTPPLQHSNAELQFCLSCIAKASAILLSVPAYWGAIGGVFKNFIDTVCGPTYELPDESTVFSTKPTAIIVVGADALSAQLAAPQAESILQHVGAKIAASTVVVEDPRDMAKLQNETANSLVACAASLAKEVLRGQ